MNFKEYLEPKIRLLKQDFQYDFLKELGKYVKDIIPIIIGNDHEYNSNSGELKFDYLSYEFMFYGKKHRCVFSQTGYSLHNGDSNISSSSSVEIYLKKIAKSSLEFWKEIIMRDLISIPNGLDNPIFKKKVLDLQNQLIDCDLDLKIVGNTLIIIDDHKLTKEIKIKIS